VIELVIGTDLLKIPGPQDLKTSGPQDPR